MIKFKKNEWHPRLWYSGCNYIYKCRRDRQREKERERNRRSPAPEVGQWSVLAGVCARVCVTETAVTKSILSLRGSPVALFPKWRASSEKRPRERDLRRRGSVIVTRSTTGRHMQTCTRTQTHTSLYSFSPSSRFDLWAPSFAYYGTSAFPTVTIFVFNVKKINDRRASEKRERERESCDARTREAAVLHSPECTSA